jgi:hypothetical protein
MTTSPRQRRLPWAAALTSRAGREIDVMTIRERAAAALVRAREAGIAVPATEPPYRQRLRAALTRDIATLLAVPAGHVVVSNDPLRVHGGVPGQLITVEDLDDPHAGLRFIPETGNTGTGGGAYLLLDACPGCSGYPRTRGDLPMVAITGLADLGNYQHCLRLNLESPAVPVEFFDDPAHAPDCPLRSSREPGEEG